MDVSEDTDARAHTHTDARTRAHKRTHGNTKPHILARISRIVYVITCGLVQGIDNDAVWTESSQMYRMLSLGQVNEFRLYLVLFFHAR
jgi:hypothetical protein